MEDSEQKPDLGLLSDLIAASSTHKACAILLVRRYKSLFGVYRYDRFSVF
ncbi:hypothetical protein CCP2SC5_1470001 [Azospirillaceae bacterium]